MPHIKVNAAQWNKLTEEQQFEIEGLLREHGLLQAEARIVGDKDTPPFQDPELDLLEASSRGFWKKAKKIACRAGCEAAAAAARAKCLTLGHPILIVACLAAVEEGRKACKSACG